jgi:hypothetical protein
MARATRLQTVAVGARAVGRRLGRDGGARGKAAVGERQARGARQRSASGEREARSGGRGMRGKTA